MPVYTLPDGAQKSFDAPANAFEIAKSIAPGLAKKTLAAKLDGQTLIDASRPIERDARVQIVTPSDPEALGLLRHSCAHLMAQAVSRLYPEAKFAIGPVIEDGFYYDMAYERPFTPEDLERIEAEMRKIVKENIKVERKEVSRDAALEQYEKAGERFKAEIVRDLPQDAVITEYTQGDFTDLCRGPHLPSTGYCKVFKLLSVAGAYWRGDKDNEMLQRIYGTAWFSKEDLDSYLKMLEEAKKRDHRKLGRAMDLFHLQDEAPGLVFWHPRGWTLWQVIEQHMRHELAQAGYKEVRTPMIMDRSLWERSGHWENYKENMFTTSSEKREFAVKPMNCPGHVQIFKSALRSYRDLPLRLAEFGSCHRNEPSGSLHGLMRVRGFVQDDAHIFCAESQIESEAKAFNNLVMRIYRQFDFNDVSVKLSLRPEKRAGSDEVWDRAEEGLRQALRACGAQWEELEGEGAFYGPKVEYHVKDALGRSWQCGTIQLDFVLPERLDAEYVAEDNSRKRPVMLHRAVIGSFERFIGMLIEHYAGAFPVWLAPVQAVAMSISEKQRDYAEQVARKLVDAGFRAEADTRDEKIGYKIRDNSAQKYPYMLVLGDEEKESGAVSVRRRGEDLGKMPLDDFIARLRADVGQAFKED